MTKLHLYCGYCGRDRDVPKNATSHDGCAEGLRMEPPRYCTRCARRMKVQVSPTSWTATCVEHGELTSP
jgi:hypothetical protein